MKEKKWYVFKYDMWIMNIFALFVAIFIGIISILIDKEFFTNSIKYVFGDRIIGMFCLLCIFYFVIHEILHSIAYCIYGAKFKNIVYGIALEKGVFYCLCKENISKKNILNSLFFPLFYMGIVTYIISFIINSPILLILSIFNIVGCCGDILAFLFLVKLDKNIKFSELDDATSFAVYSDKDISKKKSLGIKYIETKDKIERKDLIKIKISKWSYIILFIAFVLYMMYIEVELF
ncbi:MAG: DUF3267 domain-containing protein [Bacilli bacterium]|nr:DUF3267 domain-containing protein [Bacilli bacterium]